MSNAVDVVTGSEVERKKRLGQFFSGHKVADLLAALSGIGNAKIRTIIDPMAGVGDMLASAAELFRPDELVGIEIDPVAQRRCSANIRDVKGASHCILGNAFGWEAVCQLNKSGYGLVITNPPYVRYQSMGSFNDGVGNGIPDADEVRSGLIECLEKLPHLEEYYRAALLVLAKGYSGLSDLAVPAWILCCALVKPGGTLAMVVPDSWLNRDYASVVQYLLLRWFEIKVIVEDANASWFARTQIKTTLVVATRICDKKTAFGWHAEKYLHVSLSAEAGDVESLVGKAFSASSGSSEQHFANFIKKSQGINPTVPTVGVAVSKVDLANVASHLAAIAQGEKWFTKIELAPESVDHKTYSLPPLLTNWFGSYRSFVTLSDLGVDVGQGLRTGANDFFYAIRESCDGETCWVRLSKRFESKLVKLPTSCVQEVIKRQSELPSGFCMSRATATVALVFQDWALPEHAAAANADALPVDISKHIRIAAKTEANNVGDLFPALSAVAPNSKLRNERTGVGARYWYMLPTFSARHRPDLFVARVNGHTPKVVLNTNRSLVDANFSTLWLRPNAKVSSFTLLALLNSTLLTALFEYSGSILGGGALKLEATHLRKMPFPNFDPTAIMELGRLGSALCSATGKTVDLIVKSIDSVIVGQIFSSEELMLKSRELRNLVEKRQAQRMKRVAHLHPPIRLQDDQQMLQKKHD